MDFTDNVVLITGAPGSLGQAVTAAFADRGAKLALVNRSMEPLEEQFSDLNDVLLLEVDVTDEDAVRQMVDDTLAEFGRVDVLVNIVGTWRGGKHIHDEDPATFDFLMSINAKSVFLTGKYVTPHMCEQGNGKVISVAAKSGLSGNANNAAYSASKSAVIRLTEALADELMDEGVNVNCVLPSIIDTEPNRNMMSSADFDKWVTPESLADVIVFLASDMARDIHGAAIPVYGRV